MPRSSHTTPSPSIVADDIGSARSASTINGTRSLQSRPLRLNTRMLAIAPADESEAIVLDFIDPLRAFRWRPGKGGKAGRHKAGRVEELEHFANGLASATEISESRRLRC